MIPNQKKIDLINKSNDISCIWLFAQCLCIFWLYTYTITVSGDNLLWPEESGHVVWSQKLQISYSGHNSYSSILMELKIVYPI